MTNNFSEVLKGLTNAAVSHNGRGGIDDAFAKPLSMADLVVQLHTDLPSGNSELNGRLAFIHNGKLLR